MTLTQLGWTVVAAYAIFLLGSLLYNITLHPLACYPGSVIWRASRLPFIYRLLQARLPLEIHNMHEKYGKVIRVAPNELAFNTSQAWKDVYGHRDDLPDNEIPKLGRFYCMLTKHTNIFSEPAKSHKALRRLISPYFNGKTLLEQEPMIMKYIDMLIGQLRRNCQSSEGKELALDLNTWFNSTFFDIIGHFTFGQSFESLANGAEDPWVKNVNDFAGTGIAAFIFAAHVGGTRLLRYLATYVQNSQNKHLSAMTHTLYQRIKTPSTATNLVEGLLSGQNNKDASYDLILSNASIITVAGSETASATASALITLLLHNKDSLAELTREVRSSFAQNGRIQDSDLKKLEYLNACIKEAQRIYPSTLLGMPRIVPAGGATIDGCFVPKGTIVSVWPYAANHSQQNFTQAEQFCPERWILSQRSKYYNDDLNAMQPFSFGPRDCIGKHLALMEIRLIIANLLLNFDIDLTESGKNWLKQPAYATWKRSALYVYLSPVAKF